MSINVNKNETTITIHKGLVIQIHDQFKTLNSFKTINSTINREPSMELVLIQPVFTIFKNLIFVQPNTATTINAQQYSVRPRYPRPAPTENKKTGCPTH